MKGIAMQGFDFQKAVKTATDAAGSAAQKAADVAESATKKAGSIAEAASKTAGEAAGAASKMAAEAKVAVVEKASSAADKLQEANPLGDHGEKDDSSDQKKLSLDDEIELAIEDYNIAFNMLNDSGINLYQERTRTSDVLANIEQLINSIANQPKTFASDIAEIHNNRENFEASKRIAAEELKHAKEIATGGGVGIAAGAAVAAIAPTAALWVATTFGTASTGAAISTLSGAAAANAALAWLGGGAVAAGGGGMAAGNALLALAGPVGWTIAGASVLAGVILFANNKMRSNKQKQEELSNIKTNTESVKETTISVEALNDKTTNLRELLFSSFSECMSLYAADYRSLDDDSKTKLGTLVNNSKAAAALLESTVESEGE